MYNFQVEYQRVVSLTCVASSTDVSHPRLLSAISSGLVLPNVSVYLGIQRIRRLNRLDARLVGYSRNPASTDEFLQYTTMFKLIRVSRRYHEPLLLFSIGRPSHEDMSRVCRDGQLSMSTWRKSTQ